MKQLLQKEDLAVQKLFKEIMERCRQERRGKNQMPLRALAQKLGKTENYIGAFENGRVTPSIKVFLKYLLVNGFDVTLLKKLSIQKVSRTPDNEKAYLKSLIDVFNAYQLQLLKKISDLDEQQVRFLQEQAKIAETIKIKPIKDNSVL